MLGATSLPSSSSSPVSRLPQAVSHADAMERARNVLKQSMAKARVGINANQPSLPPRAEDMVAKRRAAGEAIYSSISSSSSSSRNDDLAGKKGGRDMGLSKAKGKSPTLGKKRGRSEMEEDAEGGEADDGDGEDDVDNDDDDDAMKSKPRREPAQPYTREELQWRIARWREKRDQTLREPPKKKYESRQLFAQGRRREGGRFVKKTDEEKMMIEEEKQRAKQQKEKAKSSRKKASAKATPTKVTITQLTSSRDVNSGQLGPGSTLGGYPVQGRSRLSYSSTTGYLDQSGAVANMNGGHTSIPSGSMTGGSVPIFYGHSYHDPNAQYPLGYIPSSSSGSLGGNTYSSLSSMNFPSISSLPSTGTTYYTSTSSSIGPIGQSTTDPRGGRSTDTNPRRRSTKKA